MKKLLTGILALTLVFSLTACGENKDNKDDKKEETKQTEVSKEKEADPKEAAKETVDNFMKAFSKMDSDMMAKHVDGDLPESISSIDFAAIKDETVNSLPEELSAYKPQFGDMFDSLIDKMLATIDYDILSVEEDGDNMIAKVEITMADFANLETVLNEALQTGLNEKFMEIAQEALDSGALTDDSTEQEIMDYIMPKAIDLIEDILADKINGLDKVTEEAEFTLAEVDGKWLIDANSTDF